MTLIEIELLTIIALMILGIGVKIYQLATE